LLRKNIAWCIVLVILVLTISSTAFATTDSDKNYSVTYQIEQYSFNPDYPINGLWWTVGSYNGKQGYWNSLGEFFEKLPKQGYQNNPGEHKPPNPVKK